MAQFVMSLISCFSNGKIQYGTVTNQRLPRGFLVPRPRSSVVRGALCVMGLIVPTHLPPHFLISRLLALNVRPAPGDEGGHEEPCNVCYEP